MNSPYRREADLDDPRDLAEPSREISLGTATILGIFLALALICGGFFAFGYSLGRRSAPPTVAAADTSAPLSSGGAKPAPGSLAALRGKSSDADSASTSEDQPAPVDPAPTPAAKASATVPLDTQPTARVEPVAKPAPTPTAATRSTPATGAALAGQATVQVAAVSHPEDADILLSALKKRGYIVGVHHEPQDKLLHVQIGPFSSKKEAEVMRQKLLADGYNAIVK